MRLEIIVPEGTSASTKRSLEELVTRLNEKPELVDEIWVDADLSAKEDAAIQAKFTPKVIESLEQAHQDIEAGNGSTSVDVRKSLEQTLIEWRAS